METDSGLFCVPDAIPAEARDAHFARLKRLFTDALRDAQREASGYTYRFNADELGDLGLFIQHERRCCPFLDFVVTVPAGAAEVVLRVTGPAGTPAFLEAEFGHGALAARPAPSA